MGETILDILLRDGKPVAAVPGGSCFNSIISIGRAGVPGVFVGYTGADRVGRQTVEFMEQNGVSTEYFDVRPGERSAISLAYLDSNGDADYVFYKETPRVREDWNAPEIQPDDVLIYGSYYACCTGMRSQVERMLQVAADAGAITYYDLNFRSSHRHELEALTPAILHNFRLSSIVRGSADDFEVMYGTRQAERIYTEHISQYCPLFICTAGADQISVCTPDAVHHFQAPLIPDVVSTVGAGDNFNAGFCCALLWNGITREQLPTLDREGWQQLISTACLFAGEACRSTENYISTTFGQQIRPEQ